MEFPARTRQCLGWLNDSSSPAADSPRPPIAPVPRDGRPRHETTPDPLRTVLRRQRRHGLRQRRRTAVDGHRQSPFPGSPPTPTVRRGPDGNAAPRCRRTPSASSPPACPANVLGMAHNTGRAGRDLPPQAFHKAATSVDRPRARRLNWPPESAWWNRKRNWRSSSAATAKALTLDTARSAVLGFTIGNDVTARDLQKSDDLWLSAKSQDTFTPAGPWIVTGLDPADLPVSVVHNGTELSPGEHRRPWLEGGRDPGLPQLVHDPAPRRPGPHRLPGGDLRTPRRGRHGHLPGGRHRRTHQPGQGGRTAGLARLRRAGCYRPGRRGSGRFRRRPVTATAAASRSASVTEESKLNLTAVWATSASMPSASSTGDGASDPAAHAEPLEQTTPWRSSSRSTDSPLVPGKQKDATDGSRSPDVLSAPPRNTVQHGGDEPVPQAGDPFRERVPGRRAPGSARWPGPRLPPRSRCRTAGRVPVRRRAPAARCGSGPGRTAHRSPSAPRACARKCSARPRPAPSRPAGSQPAACTASVWKGIPALPGQRRQLCYGLDRPHLVVGVHDADQRRFGPQHGGSASAVTGPLLSTGTTSTVKP